MALDEGRQELLRRLFTAATELVETAHEAATADQCGALEADGYGSTARRLRAAASDTAALAEVAIVIAGAEPGNGRNSTRSPSRKNWTFEPKQASMVDVERAALRLDVTPTGPPAGPLEVEAL